jgi:prepilin-type N-terminal cleavage/methylation domain-containing protein
MLQKSQFMSAIYRALRRDGFTLLDMMIVILIIGLLSAIAVPAVRKSQKNARDMRFVSDVRSAAQAFEQYSMFNAGYPSDCIPGEIPSGMGEYLPKMDWTERTTIGGFWDWDFQQFGVKAGVSVYRPDRTDEEMAVIDKRLDDGALNGGSFRSRSQGYIYIVEQ